MPVYVVNEPVIERKVDIEPLQKMLNTNKDKIGSIRKSASFLAPGFMSLAIEKMICKIIREKNENKLIEPQNLLFGKNQS